MAGVLEHSEITEMQNENHYESHLIYVLESFEIIRVTKGARICI